MKLRVPGRRLDVAPASEAGPLDAVIGMEVLDEVEVVEAQRDAADGWVELELAGGEEAPGPEDVAVLDWGDGLKEWLPASELVKRAGPDATWDGAPATTPTLPVRRPPPEGERGLGEFVLKGMRVLRAQVADAVLARLGARLARRTIAALEAVHMPRPGLYPVLPDANAVVLGDAPVGRSDTTTDEPLLVLIHGTGSSTTASFGSLSGTPEWEGWLQRYPGRIFALEHHTLSRSPVDNARDLLSALTDGARLHLLTHSRGGLVGELLCPAPADAAALTDALPTDGHAALRAELVELSAELERRRPRVERFVRCACPAAGTALASTRLDRYLSVALNVIGATTGAAASPVYQLLERAILAVLSLRMKPEAVPGIAAMDPAGSLVACLNTAPVRDGEELAVVAADARGGSTYERLRAFLFDLFFREPNDLVVDTASMTRGLPRRTVRTFTLRAPTAHHFGYFGDPDTRARMAEWLPAGNDAQFERLSASEDGSRGVYLFSKMPKAPRPPADGRTVLFLVPGIMGSHLAVDDRRVWLALSPLVRGRMASLAVGPGGASVRPDGLVSLAYERFYRAQSEHYRVEVYPYDWRRSLTEAADGLATALSAELAAHRQPVRLVAHSMGGLVARLVMARHPEVWSELRARDGRLLMLGTPNRGSWIVPRILAREEPVVHWVAGADLCHDLEEVTEIVAPYPGLLEMLPEDEELDLFAPAAWEEALDWACQPDAAALERARHVRDALAAAVDPEGMLYLAGQAAATPAGVREGRFEYTREGDGRVPWELGRLEGVRTWYVRAEHGDLADHEPSYAGIRDLLEQGRTSQLATLPPAARGPAPAPAPEPYEVRTYPDETALMAAALGMGRRRQREEPESVVTARVVHGDLYTARHPIVVGHYVGDRLAGSEARVDEALHHQLSRLHRLGVYPGPLNTSEIWLRAEDDVPLPGAIVVGLGEVGELSREALRETLTSALLRFALERLRSEGGEGWVSAAFSSLLIGTAGGTTISVRDCVEIVLKAALAVNRRLVDEDLWDRVRIDRVEFVEFYRDLATEAAHVLRELSGRSAPHLHGRIEAAARLGEAEGGRVHRVVAGLGGGWVGHVRIAADVPEDGTEPEAVTYEVVSDRARAPVVHRPIQWRVVRKLLAAARSGRDQRAPQTLHSYLLPRALHSAARQGNDLLLILDEHTAQVPWELLDPSRASGELPPLGVRSAVLRQFRSREGRVEPRSGRRRRALVIGDPEGPLDPLPGAQREAEAAAALLERRGFEVRRVLRGTAREVLDAIHECDYEVLHIAAHGNYDADNPRRTGVVLEDGLYLTSIELSNIAAPTVVVFNCCHLGRVDTPLAVQHPGGLAASVAQTLIQNGAGVVAAAGWAVDDAAAERFASSLYDELFAGETLLRAVRQARRSAYDVQPNGNTWGAYQVYGDPGFVLARVEREASQGPEETAGSRELVASHELERALRNLAARVREAGRDQERLARLRARAADLWERAARDWRQKGSVRAALARVYRDLGDFDEAILHYEAALTTSDAPLEVVEQLGNLLARQASALGTMRALETLDRALRRLAAIAELAPTVERHCLLGSLYKRKALVLVRGAPERGGLRLEALTAMAEAYRRAHELALETAGVADPYPANNLAVAWALLERPAGEVAAILEASRTGAAQRSKADPTIWVRLADADASFVGLVAGIGDEDSAGVADAYGHALAAGGTPAVWRSVREHVESIEALAAAGHHPAAGAIRAVLGRLREAAPAPEPSPPPAPPPWTPPEPAGDRRRVAAHFVSDEQEARAREVLDEIECGEAFHLGTATAAEVRELEAAGLFVDVLAATPAESADTATRGSDLGGSIRPRSWPARLEAHLRGPLTDARREVLESDGVRLLERTAVGAYLLEVAGQDALAALRGRPFVASLEEVTRQTPAGAPSGLRSAGGTADEATPHDPVRTWDVLARAPLAEGELAGWLERRPGVTVVGRSAKKLRIVAPETVAADAEARADVEAVWEVGRRRLLNDRAGALVGAPGFEALIDGRTVELRGAGECVGVADTGIDDGHPDFQGRVRVKRALGRPGDPSDPHGHGTHVAGTVLGDGKASDGRLAGVAPEAELFFQSILDDWGGLGGLPVDLYDLFGAPYEDGVRVHNNSWGADLVGRYTGDATEIDRFVHEHPDLLVVIAAGNAGSLTPSHPTLDQTTADHEVELLSVGSPATSKNALVVGASRSSRESGGYARYAHREVWPERFSAATGVSADNVSGDPASLAGFSSRGPCDDDRLKPDLVAPGTDVLSTRSQDAPGSSFWGTSAAHGGAYAYMGGTSMAAPLAAGCAALVREYYRRRGHDRPSAALIKATLLNGARRLHGTDATAGPDGEPNFHQGFGCVFLPSTLPSADNGLSLAFVDTWSDGTPPLRNGGRHQWEVEVGPGAPLRICLAYSDVPARALQNDLDVFVVGPGTSRWRGNAAAPVGLVRGPDRRNNVEAVRIPEPEAGRYLVQVTAWNLLHGPQHYALVVTAAPSSPGEASCHLRRRS